MTAPALPSLRTLWRRSRFELCRRLRPAVDERFQPYPYTQPDRYPWLFDFAASALKGVQSPRLLSFGCSRGDEVFSLRRRFAGAAIKGVDIDPLNIETCLARARALGDDQLSFAAGSNTRNEPTCHYDAIFCLAVLCHGDLTIRGAQRSEALLRLEDFERTVADLARCLKPDGLLLLHTTNFRFGDTAAADAFEVVLEAQPEQMAGDALFDRQGRRMAGERYYPVGFRKRTMPG